MTEQLQVARTLEAILAERESYNIAMVESNTQFELDLKEQGVNSDDHKTLIERTFADPELADRVFSYDEANDPDGRVWQDITNILCQENMLGESIGLIFTRQQCDMRNLSRKAAEVSLEAEQPARIRLHELHQQLVHSTDWRAYTDAYISMSVRFFADAKGADAIDYSLFNIMRDVMNAAQEPEEDLNLYGCLHRINKIQGLMTFLEGHNLKLSLENTPTNLEHREPDPHLDTRVSQWSTETRAIAFDILP